MPAMEPQIQYARTSDGFGIAYWTLGEGPVLVNLPPMPQHVQLDWRLPDMRDFYAWLSRQHRLVRFDFRGRGLSERGDIEVTHETELLDLEAVVARLGLDSFDIMGAGMSAGVAARYAARHPEQVARLVLIDTSPSFRAIGDLPWVRALGAVLEADYFTYTELVSYMSRAGAATNARAGTPLSSATP
jgi:pimeloyl-ACP methyl ester carboxylesterase